MRKLYVVFGQRHEKYAGEHAPEALEVVDDFSMDDASMWLHEKVETHRRSGNFSSVQIVNLSFDSDKVRSLLNPSANALNIDLEDTDGD